MGSDNMVSTCTMASAAFKSLSVRCRKRQVRRAMFLRHYDPLNSLRDSLRTHIPRRQPTYLFSKRIITAGSKDLCSQNSGTIAFPSKTVPSQGSFTMPHPARFNFAYNSILLDHQKIQTRRAVSRVKANYHLFLRNQPQKPRFTIQDLGPSRKWKVPKMKHLSD